MGTKIILYSTIGWGLPILVWQLSQAKAGVSSS